MFEPHLDLNTIDNLIHSVSQCGVQDLKLEYDDEDSFPSSLFQCVELRHLGLKFVQLELPPSNFRKFSSLVSLKFFRASVFGEMLTVIILNCPLLEFFSLEYMEIEALLILSAPKLKDLYIRCLQKFQIFHFNLKTSKEYLRSQAKQVDSVWRFRTVTITHLMGDEPEMIFIEVILSGCPNLETF